VAWWRAVGSVITRVVDDARVVHDPFEGPRRIGVDEVSDRREVHISVTRVGLVESKCDTREP
jgi:hypothetical protein